MSQINYDSMLDELAKIAALKEANWLSGLGGAIRSGAGALGRAGQLVAHDPKNALNVAKMVPGAEKSTAQAGFQAAKAAPTTANKLIGAGAIGAGALGVGAAGKAALGGGGQRQGY